MILPPPFLKRYPKKPDGLHRYSCNRSTISAQVDVIMPIAPSQRVYFLKGRKTASFPYQNACTFTFESSQNKCGLFDRDTL